MKYSKQIHRASPLVYKCLIWKCHEILPELGIIGIDFLLGYRLKSNWSKDRKELLFFSGKLSHIFECWPSKKPMKFIRSLFLHFPFSLFGKLWEMKKWFQGDVSMKEGEHLRMSFCLKWYFFFSKNKVHNIRV